MLVCTAIGARPLSNTATATYRFTETNQTAKASEAFILKMEVATYYYYFYYCYYYYYYYFYYY